jgi:uncharacterized membrane-anchored protein YitT (DUF2179 family)
VSSTVGRVAQTFKQVILLFAGVCLFVIAIRGLILPQKLLTGGVTGLALLLHALLGWKIGLLTLIFNIPIFLLGFRDLGRRFAFYSGLAVVGFWLLVDHLPVPVLTHDPLLASIFGGLLGGVGSALAVRAGGSLGGFDILGVVLNRRFSLGIGEVGLILNGMLIVAAGLIENPERAMYTLVSIYVGSRTLDALQTPRPRKAVLIVSKENRAIKERLLFEMGRGVTLLKAEGAYTGEDTNVLICVITRFELKELRDIVKNEDPQAFVSVLEASDVVGRFKRPSAFSFLKGRRNDATWV